MISTDSQPWSRTRKMQINNNNNNSNNNNNNYKYSQLRTASTSSNSRLRTRYSTSLTPTWTSNRRAPKKEMLRKNMASRGKVIRSLSMPVESSTQSKQHLSTILCLGKELQLVWVFPESFNLFSYSNTVQSADAEWSLSKSFRHQAINRTSNSISQFLRQKLIKTLSRS
jgi:hypothetical protein